MPFTKESISLKNWLKVLFVSGVIFPIVTSVIIFNISENEDLKHIRQESFSNSVTVDRCIENNARYTVANRELEKQLEECRNK